MRLSSFVASICFFAGALHADQPSPLTQASAIAHLWLDTFSPPNGQPPTAFTTEIEVTSGKGIPSKILGQRVSLAWQAPARLRLSSTIENETYSLGRVDDLAWGHAASKQFGLIGDPAVPPYSTDTQPDGITLPDFKIPFKREQLMLLPVLFKIDALPQEDPPLESSLGLRISPRPAARVAMKLPDFTLTLWVTRSTLAPIRITYSDRKKTEFTVTFHQPEFHPTALPDSHWQIPAVAGDTVETVALSHLTRCLSAALSTLDQKLPSLGPTTGQRHLIAQHQGGRLEDHDGTRVLFLQGTPEQMGNQHGHLMKKEVRHLVDRILYGVGVGSSFAKGRWFFGEIESAQARLQPFTNPRYLREMDAMATAADIRVEEARLANFFPELFHCSGFALYGKATQDGTLYHGRILDYMKGVGLEQNACVMVIQPDQGHAWVNLGYAGFLGTVTAMNDQHIAIGEMGGRGEGQWDGKPMAQLLREVMESASTLDDAIEIMRTSPRTCEYYYVISDGKTNRAVGIAATPDRFELIWAGDTHPQLPRPVVDAVLLSAGDRYDALVERVTSGYGQFDADRSRDLMTRPVCMNSNIQSVLFAPENLDFWVANADSENLASHTRYTHYNLRQLLESPPAKPASRRSSTPKN